MDQPVQLVSDQERERFWVGKRANVSDVVVVLLCLPLFCFFRELEGWSGKVAFSVKAVVYWTHVASSFWVTTEWLERYVAIGVP